jgi:hypothetical protein
VTNMVVAAQSPQRPHRDLVRMLVSSITN